MQVSPGARFVLAMTFMSIVLGVSLWKASVDLVVGVAIWLFVVGVFGVYLYFRMVRPRRRSRDQDS